LFATELLGVAQLGIDVSRAAPALTPPESRPCARNAAERPPKLLKVGGD